MLASGYSQWDPTDYDKTLCTISKEVITFLESYQHDCYTKLHKQLGDGTTHHNLKRLGSEPERRGVLSVLREEIKTRGVHLRFYFSLLANTLNPDHCQLYRQNRLGVVGQLKYSTKNENSIDMMLLLNGPSIITAELKNSPTGQFVENAIKHNKYDRNPKGERLI